MASSNSTTSWMPAQGKYQVTIGSSLGRALKTRKQGGTPPATNSKRNLPDKDFYSFRYNFKPPSIDPTKPGTIEVRKGKDKTHVVVEHLSSQAGEAYVFTGNETQTKEWDCVLIYDEETGAYTLEKLDSFLNLTWERKRTPTARAASPVAPSPADMDAEGEDDDGELDKEILGLAEDLLPVHAKPQRHPPSRPPRKEEEEEDIEEILTQSIEAQREPTPPPPPPPRPKPQPSKASRPTKALPKARASAVAAPTTAVTAPEPVPPVALAPPPAPPVKQKSKPKKKKEPEMPVIDPDVEVMEFGVPAKHAEAPISAPPSPAPPVSSGFALPGSSSSGVFQPPPAPPSSKAQRAPPVPPQPTVPAVPDEDSEEEWEEVKGSEDNDDIFGDDDGEGDMEDVLAQELDEGMEDLLEQDFLTAELSQDNEQPVPISLNKFAGGLDDSDEDFSSSEDSDDD